MAMAMMKQQRSKSKLNWEGILKLCCRSTHHRPAHWEGMLKWRGEAQQQQQPKYLMVTVKEEEVSDAFEPPNNNFTTADVTSLQNTIHVLNNSVQHLTEQMTNMFQQLQTTLLHVHQAQPSGGLLIQDDDSDPAHSDGTHHTPARRWEEGMSKPPWILEQQEPSAGILLQDGRRRPAYSPPPPPPPVYDPDADSDRPAAYVPHNITAQEKYVAMGWIRPWNLHDAMQKLIFSGGILVDDPAHSDGTPAPRWWEIKYKKPWRLPSGIQDDHPPPQLSMVESISNWEGRLKRWKLCHTLRPYPRVQDVVSVQDAVAERVCQIAEWFKVPEDPDDITIEICGVEQFEYSLDDVQGYFEFMDLAHELHSIDCLFPLLHHVLVYPYAASIRAKAAELVTAMVHNNLRSQYLVMDLLGLKPLWYNYTSDPDTTSRTKALGAISALIRNNESGMHAFRQLYGSYAKLGDALSSADVSFQREAVNLFRYLLHENREDSDREDFQTNAELGLPKMMMDRASGDDAEARVNAFRGLLVLAKDEDQSIGQLMRNDVQLKQILQERIKRISAMAPEDLVAAREEIQIVDSIWNACYNEPSSLKLFEPSPRAWVAADRKLPIEKTVLGAVLFFLLLEVKKNSSTCK